MQIDRSNSQEAFGVSIYVVSSEESRLPVAVATRRDPLVAAASWMWRFLIEGFATYAHTMYPGLVVHDVAAERDRTDRSGPAD